MPRKHKKNRSKRMRGGFDMGSLNPFGNSTGTTSTSSSTTGTGWFDSLKKNG